MFKNWGNFFKIKDLGILRILRKIIYYRKSCIVGEIFFFIFIIVFEVFYGLDNGWFFICSDFVVCSKIVKF